MARKELEEFLPDVGWERWRGAVDENLKNINRGQDELKGAITQMTNTITTAVREAHAAEDVVHRDFDKRIRTLETHNTITKTKVAIFAGFSGVVGGGLASAAWGILFHKWFG